MISYIAHIPHSPLVLPNISKGKFYNFKKTYNAIQNLAGRIQAAGCDTVITVNFLGYGNKNAYVMNVSPKFEINFSKFGDFSTSKQIYGEIPTAYWARRELEEEYPVSSITQYEMDFQSAVAAVSIQSGYKQQYKILPLSLPDYLPEKHFIFGKKLRETLERPENRTAIIAIGDLSKSNQESGLSKARRNDNKIMRLLSENNAKQFINYAQQAAKEFPIRGLAPLSLILGVMDGMARSFNTVHYEQKYGVGMLVANFEL